MLPLTAVWNIWLICNPLDTSCLDNWQTPTEYSSVVRGGGQMGATAPSPTGTRPSRGIQENPMRKNGVGWGCMGVRLGVNGNGNSCFLHAVGMRRACMRPLHVACHKTAINPMALAVLPGRQWHLLFITLSVNQACSYSVWHSRFCPPLPHGYTAALCGRQGRN